MPVVESIPAYTPATKIAARIVDGQLVILRPGSDELLRFNAVASFVWAQIETTPKTLDSLTDAVIDAFDIDREGARRDLVEFLDEMQSQGLIRRHDP